MPSASRDVHTKIVVLGASSVGKTSIVVRGVRQEFYEFSEPTIGAAFHSMRRGSSVIEIWDTAGQERYRSLAPMYYRGSGLAVVVYDTTDLETVDRAREWIDELRGRLPACPIILVGNKTDLRCISEMGSEIISERASSLCVTTPSCAIPVRHFLVSAKTGDSIDVLFDCIFEQLESATELSATGSSATELSATGSSATGSSATGSSATGSSATGSSATGFTISPAGGDGLKLFGGRC
jgi:Ras-related protein Rab-5C